MAIAAKVRECLRPCLRDFLRDWLLIWGTKKKEIWSIWWRGKERSYTLEEMKRALEKAGGIKTEAARLAEMLAQTAVFPSPMFGM
jgi:hypothetical protein